MQLFHLENKQTGKRQQICEIICKRIESCPDLCLQVKSPGYETVKDIRQEVYYQEDGKELLIACNYEVKDEGEYQQPIGTYQVRNSEEFFPVHQILIQTRNSQVPN